jgi:hypothetical protein
MITVFKTTLKIEDEQKVKMQQGSRIVKVGEQQGKLTLWYVCDPEAEMVEETFYVVATGQQMPDTFPGAYVDSVQVGDFKVDTPPQMVWHVFFKRKPNVNRGKTVIRRVNPNDDGADIDVRGEGNGA